MAFDKAKEKIRAEFAQPIERIAVLAGFALILAALALLVAMGGRRNGS